MLYDSYYDGGVDNKRPMIGYVFILDDYVASWQVILNFRGYQVSNTHIRRI